MPRLSPPFPASGRESGSDRESDSDRGPGSGRESDSDRGPDSGRREKKASTSSRVGASISGTPMRSSMSPRKSNLRRISALVAGKTAGSSHRLVSSGSSSAISRA